MRAMASGKRRRRLARTLPSTSGPETRDGRRSVKAVFTRLGRVRHPALIPAIITVVTFLAFLPALHNEFVDWDDDRNLTNNPSYRGLGWTQLAWMFGGNQTNFYMPLTWLTYGVDYTLWGMNPSGYHLTSLILHALNAAVFYLVALRLLGAAGRAGAIPDAARRAGAALAALLFSLHPLRVESVVWATERRDVLSGLFYLLAILAYLRACEPRPPGDRRGRAWYWGAVAMGVCALLSKPMAASLPLILVLLDIYPLRRLGGSPAAWLAPAARRVWWEKLPFVLLSAATIALTLLAFPKLNDPTALPQVGSSGRLVIPLYALAFYLWKTVEPWGLSPTYETPVPFEPTAWPFLLSAAVVAGVTLTAVALRRRWPALLIVWLGYVAVLLPVLGVVQFHFLIAADRYTYLACLGWALLGGWVFVRAWEFAGRRPRGRLRPAVATAAVVLLAVLGALTWRQTGIWHDSESLWAPVLAARPSLTAQFSVGLFYYRRGRFQEAADRFRGALALRPDRPDVHFNLGRALQAQGRQDEAVASYRRALELRPDMNVVSANLGDLLISQGRWNEAEKQFRELLNRDPEFSEAHNSLGVVLYRQDRAEESLRHYRKAIDLRPEYAEARYNLGNALMRLGRWREAGEQLQQAVSLNPDLPDFHNSLGVTLAQQGRVGEAIEHFQVALRLDPANDEARENLRIAMSQQAGAPSLR